MLHKESRLKIPSALIMGLVSGVAVSILVAILIAILINAGNIQEGVLDVAAMVAILLGAMTAALVTVGKVKEKRFVMCIAAGAVYLLGLMMIAAVLFDGVKGGIGASAAVVFGGVLAVFLMGMNRGKRPKYKMPKLRL